MVAHSTAFGIGSTAIRLTDVLALCSTAFIGITEGSRVTGASALTQSVLAVSVLSTSWRALGLLDGWHTDQVGITHKVRLADALSIVSIAGGSDATDHTLAALLASSIDANLPLATRSGGRTLIRAAATAGEGIAELSLRALTGGSLASWNAESTIAADHVLALRHAVPIAIFDVSHTTATPASMLLCLTVGIRSTQKTAAWTYAATFQAG